MTLKWWNDIFMIGWMDQPLHLLFMHAYSSSFCWHFKLTFYEVIQFNLLYISSILECNRIVLSINNFPSHFLTSAKTVTTFLSSFFSSISSIPSKNHDLYLYFLCFFLFNLFALQISAKIKMLCPPPSSYSTKCVPSARNTTLSQLSH